MKKSIFIVVLSICTLLINNYVGQVYYSPQDIPNPKEFSDGFISDPQGYIDDSDEIYMMEDITELRDKKGFEIAVVVVSSINDQPVLEFATELINLWGVGKGDRGILLLVAVDDRNMAFATGYETEQFLPDLVTKSISDEEILPYFKTEQYGVGLRNGIYVIKNILLDENIPPYIEEAKTFSREFFYFKFYLLIASVLLILLTLKSNPTSTTIKTIGIIVLLVGAISVVLHYWLKNEGKWSNYHIFDIFCIFTFVGLSITAYVLNKSGKFQQVWINLTIQTIIILSLLTAAYVYQLYDMLYFYGLASFAVFALFVIFYCFTFLVKDPYRKYHIVQFLKLSIFRIVFPIPMIYVRAFILKKLDDWRNAVRFSLKTGLEMYKLDESADNKYLKSGQVTEEKIKSVDYDVWVSGEPDDLLILKYSNWFSGYSNCEKCRFETWYQVYDKTLSAATYSSSGTGERQHACHHCQHRVTARYTIPKLQKSSSSSGGSSSSSGGGSWGGGRSGGGGSSSSW